LAKFKAAAQISNVDDIVEKYSESCHPAVDRLEKLDFYQDHLNMLDLRRNRRGRRNKEVRGFASEFTN